MRGGQTVLVFDMEMVFVLTFEDGWMTGRGSVGVFQYDFHLSFITRLFLLSLRFHFLYYGGLKIRFGL